MTTTAREDATFGGNSLSWSQWQRDVLGALHADLQELAGHLRLDDVDWSSWQVFYRQGHTPRSAVARALERDL